jgi:drug/metabolite transporter (DMT)-like permease
MELWVVITFAAAFTQNLRSALQKYLKGAMSTTSATYVRFSFGLPFALAFVIFMHWGLKMAVPAVNPVFLSWVVVGGIGQIVANFLLIHLFSFRNFVVGTAYSRTEPMQAAIFGFVFLGDRPGPKALAAIAIAVVGVMIISVARSQRSVGALLSSIFSRTAGIGILSGTLFGLAAVAYRAASLSLGGPNFAMQAAFTLLVAITLQTVLMTAWIAWREAGQFALVAASWRPALATGIAGAFASFGWFAAMTLQQASIVKAVAQVEIVFTVIASTLFFRESVNAREMFGTALIVAGILLLLLK